MAHIFISYSRRNQPFARQLTAKLLAEGFDVWIDDRIDYGENWWTTIVEAIKDSAAVIVIMSPDSHQSRWVQREVTLADQWQKPTFPILLQGENWPIFVLTQYAIVQNNALPEPDFYERLAEIVPRSSSPGNKVTPPQPAATAAVPQKSGVPQPYLIGLLLLLAAIALIFGASRLLNPEVVATTTTPAATDTLSTATQAPESTSIPSSVPSNDNLTLIVTANQVRVRQTAAADGLAVGILNNGDQIESLETAAETRAKLGSADQWIHIRAKSSIEGYVAAEAVTEITASTAIAGVNLAPLQPLGLPDPARLQGMGWIRLNFNVSYNPDENSFGNTNMVAACNRYIAILQPYVDVGLKVIVVFTHQLFGEGAGYNWTIMSAENWDSLIPVYADLARTAAGCLSQAGVVHAYQIWQEQDTPPANARAAVPVPPDAYARLLTATIQSIRTVDATTPIITGGHATGASQGVAYAEQVLALMPDDVRPDGIAFHPYGNGPAGNQFTYFGALEEVISVYAELLPDKPVWITEWGVLDRQNDDSIAQDVADYARGFLDIIDTEFPDQIAAAVWYAWADGIDNGYGLVDENDQTRESLYQVFIQP